MTSSSPPKKNPLLYLGGHAVRWTWLLVFFFVAWDVLFRLHPSRFIQPTLTILSNMGTTWFSGSPTELFTSTTFRTNALPSLERFAEGWAVAVVVGILGGLLLGASRIAEMVFKPLLRFGVSVPATIFLPIAVVIFGITDRMNIFLIAMGAVWPVLLNTMDGIRTIDPAIRDSARSIRITGWRLLRKVILPAASPQIFAGLRVSLGIALVLMVISEMFVGTNGIGFQIMLAQRTFRFPMMWSAVALLGIIAIIMNGIFFFVERAFLSWHRRRDGGQA